MAQSSRPQPGNINSSATYVDSGPYSGNQWASLFRVLFTGDQEATQGVLHLQWTLVSEYDRCHDYGQCTGRGFALRHIGAVGE